MVEGGRRRGRGVEEEGGAAAEPQQDGLRRPLPAGMQFRPTDPISPHVQDGPHVHTFSLF